MPTVAEESTYISRATIAKMCAGRERKVKRAEGEEERRLKKEMQPNVEELFAIESAEESGRKLLMDHEAEGMHERGAETRQEVESTGSYMSASPTGPDARTPKEV